jgi:hypothetical protein
VKKKHAIHNKNACAYLLKSKKYNDWVITTAFYSALHFVQNEIFPLKDAGTVYPDFNIYFSKVLRKKNRKLNKHAATIQLVNTHLTAVSSYYRWLHDACMTTRYKNYIVSDNKALHAKNILDLLVKQMKK